MLGGLFQDQALQDPDSFCAEVIYKQLGRSGERTEFGEREQLSR